jgi:hypothetical protein
MTEREWKKLKAELHKMSRERFMEWLQNLPVTPENFGVLRAVLSEVFDAWVDEESELDSLRREAYGAGMYHRKKPRK